MSGVSNPRQYVLDAIERSTSPSPAVVATEILSSLPSNMLRPLLALSLTGYVRNAMRNGASFDPPSLAPDPAPANSADHIPVPGRPPATDHTPAPNKKSIIGPSWRVAAKEWSVYLNQSVNIAPGVDKCMAACTLADLRRAAEQRRKMAEGNLVAARQIDRLIDLMVKHGAATAGDVPAAAGLTFLDAA